MGGGAQISRENLIAIAKEKRAPRHLKKRERQWPPSLRVRRERRTRPTEVPTRKRANALCARKREGRLFPQGGKEDIWLAAAKREKKGGVDGSP